MNTSLPHQQLFFQAPLGEREDTEDARTDTIYYQWIPFMFVLNGIVFKLPEIIGQMAQGGDPNSVKIFVTKESGSKFVSQNLQTRSDKPGEGSELK